MGTVLLSYCCVITHIRDLQSYGRDCCSLSTPSGHIPHLVNSGEMLEKRRKVVKSSTIHNKKYFSCGLDYHKRVKLCLDVYQGLLLPSKRVSAKQKEISINNYIMHKCFHVLECQLY